MALTLAEMHSPNCKLFGSRTCKYRQSSILWTKKVKGRIVCSWCWPNPLNDHVEDWSGDHEMWWCVHGCAQSALPTHSPCTLVTHTCVTIIVSLPPCSAPTCGLGSVTAGETILMILWWWHLSVSTGVWHSLLCAAVSPLTTHCIDVDGLETRPTLQYTCHLGAPTVHLYTPWWVNTGLQCTLLHCTGISHVSQVGQSPPGGMIRQHKNVNTMRI